MFKNWKTNYSLSLILLFICIGLSTIVFILFVKWFYGSLSNAGTVGDSFGMLNTIFSGLTFAGLLITIVMQQKELKNQRKELKSQRQEFSMNRTTTVVYNQLERFENAVKEFSIKIGSNTYKGSGGLAKLDNLRLNEAHAEQDDRVFTYKPFATELNQLAYALYNSFIGSFYVILASDLGITEKNQLKDLYYINVGTTYYHLFKDIVNVTDEYSNKTLEKFDITAISQEWLWEMESVRVFLSAFTSFYNTIFTDDTMEYNVLKFNKMTGSFLKTKS